MTMKLYYSVSSIPQFNISPFLQIEKYALNLSYPNFKHQHVQQIAETMECGHLVNSRGEVGWRK